jgi:hypothetical protein
MEQYLNNSVVVGDTAGGNRGRSGSASSTDLLGKLRGKIKESKKESKARKEQKEALEESGGMDTEFWNQKQRKLRLDLSRMQILEPLVEAVEVDGFVCVMKELDIGFAKELNVNLVKTFESGERI